MLFGKSIALLLSRFLQALVISFYSYHIRLIYCDLDDNLYDGWLNYTYPRTELDRRELLQHGWFSTSWGFTKDQTFLVDPSYLFIHTSSLIISFLLSFWAIPKFLTYTEAYKKPLVHVAPPKQYVNQTSIVSWLEQFDNFIDAQMIRDNQQRCNSLLSRLDVNDTDMVKCYLMNRSTNMFCPSQFDYVELKNALLKLFCDKEVNETEAQAAFAGRAQHKTENIHKYFAVLNGLCRKAFEGLSLKDRERLVVTRFINGLESDGLRQKILTEHDPNKPKKVLDIAEKFQKICNSKQIGEAINVLDFDSSCTCSVPDAGGETVCTKCKPSVLMPTEYERNKAFAFAIEKGKKLCLHCKVSGHLKLDCPSRLTSSHVCDKVRKDISDVRELNGVCKIDGIDCNFLTDTGASRTVVNARIIPEERMKAVKPFHSVVITANGSCANIVGSLKVRLRIGDYTIVADVLIARDLSKDCLMGMDVLTTYPPTKGALTRLHQAIAIDVCPDSSLPESLHTKGTSKSTIFQMKTLSRQDYQAMLVTNDSMRCPSVVSEACSEPLGVCPKNDFKDVFDVLDSGPIVDTLPASSH